MGMLSELAQSHREVEEVFRIASDVSGIDLWKLVSEGPTDLLNKTENTQPLMLAAGVAIWRVWRKKCDIVPGWMAGHSLGEYSALVCSKAIAFEDAVALVRERARLMQEAVPENSGAMAAILGLDDPEVVRLCHEVAQDEVVAPVNFNSPGQVVIAGDNSAVSRAIDRAKEKGARRACVLPVSVPSHCSLMQPASEKLAEYLKNISINTPEVPIIHNVDVASHAAPDVIRSVLVKQLYNSVRWADSVKFMHDQGVRTFVEGGPGKVLTGLNKRIVPKCDTLPIFDNNSLEKALSFLS